MDPMAEKGRKTKGRIVRDGEYGGDASRRRGEKRFSHHFRRLLRSVG